MKKLIESTLLLLLLFLVVGCSKDSDTDIEEPEIVTISNLDFNISVNEENSLQVGVVPQATNATSYKIYFDSEGSSDFQTTTGTIVTHTYPEIGATYKIKVVASAPNASDVERIKDHTVIVEEATIIADFESQSSIYILDGQSEDKINASIAASPDASNTTSVLKINNKGEEYEAVTIINSKNINVTSKKVISLDFYQENANSPSLLLKLEGNSIEGGFDVEVSKTAAAISGWQTIEFDFNDAKNSYPNHEEPNVTLGEYQKLVFFIGFAQTDFAGDYYIDNIVGAEFGEDQSDLDSDSVWDALDDCPNTPGSVDTNGCPAGPSVPAIDPSLDSSEVLAIYSDFYSGTPVVTTYQTDWSSNCTIVNSEIQSGAYAIKATITSENGYAGIQFESPFDITDYNAIHMDVWSPDMSNFRFKLEGSGAIEYTVPIDQNNQWISKGYLLSDFSIQKSGAKDDINLIVLSSENKGQVYVDNIYFYNDSDLESNSLNMSVTVPEGTNSVRLTGEFWEWDPEGGPVAEDNGDGTWTVKFPTPPNEDMKYLWVVNGALENLLDNVESGECSSKVEAGTIITDNSTYANRLWLAGSTGPFDDVFDSCN